MARQGVWAAAIAALIAVWTVSGAGPDLSSIAAAAPIASTPGPAIPALMLADIGSTSTAPGAGDHCPNQQEIYATIARVTDGADAGDIATALDALLNNPSAATSPLAQQLREALDLDAANPCADLRSALTEALRLARLASAQDNDDATSALPFTPLSEIPSAEPGGADSNGYN